MKVIKIKKILAVSLLCLTIIACTNENEVVNIIEDNYNKLDNVEKWIVEENSKVKEIEKAINEVAGKYKDNIAVYYYNFDCDEKYCFNEDKYYITASLRKIPQMMEVADKLQAGNFTLDTKIKYKSEDYHDGTGILQFEDEIGKRTVRELMELSIKESDNIAFYMLSRFCGNDLIPYIRKLINDNEIPDGEYKLLTATQHYKILSKLYENPNNNPYYPMIIEYMKDTAFNDSMNKYLPKGTVAHKIGSYFRYYHDMGFVFGKENYMLVILTKDIGELSNDPKYSKEQEERHIIDWGKEANEVIAQISKRIYNIVEEN